jgi:F-type H+-transporting ATPase subunit a
VDGGIHIALKAEEIAELFGFPITNTLITSVVITLFLIAGAFFIGRNLRMVPSKGQLVVEEAISGVLSYVEETLDNKRIARLFFPLIMTLFLFIFTSNVTEFLPGIGSVGFFEEGGHGSEGGFVALFRSVNTDLNVTLALALVSFFVIQFSGVAVLGFVKYAGKFVSFKSVLGFFIGIIELFSEVARLISFSFRLFGNIFAGEVLILVVAFFVPVLLPVPLMAFELFVGFIQAAIFSLLTLFFIKIAITDVH